MPPAGDLACNPGTCLDWELNWQPFSCQASAQPTELHQPGQSVAVLKYGLQILWRSLHTSLWHLTNRLWWKWHCQFLSLGFKTLAVSTSCFLGHLLLEPNYHVWGGKDALWWGPCGGEPTARTTCQQAWEWSSSSSLAATMTPHGTETSCCHSALPTPLFPAIKFCGGLLCSKRLLEQIVVPEIGCHSNKSRTHMTLTLGLGIRKKHKGPPSKCWEGCQWELKGKWEKSYWKMEDRRHTR